MDLISRKLQLSLTSCFILFITIFCFFSCLHASDLDTVPTLKSISPEFQSKPIIIAIDPGHPSETSGGCAHHGLKEVDICWEVALKLEKLIAADPDLYPVKTKIAVNTKVTNKRRAEIANQTNSAILIRLHCDSGKGTGCTVYYPDKPGSKKGVTGPSSEVIAQSKIAAKCMNIGLKKILAKHLKINSIRTDSMTYVGSKQGALTGSIFSKVPAIVVEMVYLNNASDAAFIKETKGQNLIANGILAGIKEFTSNK